MQGVYIIRGDILEVLVVGVASVQKQRGPWPFVLLNLG
jgi:hypothetical protein